jgi:hypothetical protein
MTNRGSANSSAPIAAQRFEKANQVVKILIADLLAMK